MDYAEKLELISKGILIAAVIFFIISLCIFVSFNILSIMRERFLRGKLSIRNLEYSEQGIGLTKNQSMDLNDALNTQVIYGLDTNRDEAENIYEMVEEIILIHTDEVVL